jgi:uncharacterized protein (TIGR03437 family)
MPLTNSRYLVAGALLCAIAASGAPPSKDRITRKIDLTRTAAIPGMVHRLAAPEFDRGAVDPGMRLNYVTVFTKRTPTQQADLDGLLSDQQNPSSPLFHKWLTPEEFADRFGLSANDQTKIAAWLRSEGFTIRTIARGRSWIAFSGTAEQVSKTLHTEIHRFDVKGVSHFANSTNPSVPEALADVVDGFSGLNDFKLTSDAHLVPDYNSGTSHYLTPADYATIYNIAPLYQNGLDGTGVNIAVVGESAVLLTDLQAFKTRYGLPANSPKMINYDGVNPGFNGAQVEGNLDLEWSSAIAPNATIYYVYGASAFSAMIAAIDANYAPIITESYSGCEVDFAQPYYRAAAQQGNAQGITILNSTGDAGAAGCDSQGSYAFAEGGESTKFPPALPEVTGVGGTQFVESTGTYWAPTNSATFGSALSYIPETVWNESSSGGLLAGGGGTSKLYPRPAWQTGPGVPMDNARHVPDVSLSAAGHDGYEITYFGSNTSISGTSASTPSMAGIVALLNQYQVLSGQQSKPGLGNINPQLYRLAQTSPSVFHDITTGSNIVPCGQGSPECLTGSFGYQAGPGYDMATGLGSIDVNALVMQWNTTTQNVTVTLVATASKVTANDSIQLTATVAAASGAGTPTGTVSFSAGTTALGASPVAADGTATISFPAYLIGTGTYSYYAEYSGDTVFSSGGASARVQITTPTGAASIIPTSPTAVLPQPPDAAGQSWQTTITLREVAGVAAMVTGFSIDGAAQPVAQYFSQPNILPRGSVSISFVLRNQPAPLTHTYGFSGIDALGNSWSRQVSVNYLASDPEQRDIRLTATPQIVTQNLGADSSCQWPVSLHLDNLGGVLDTITNLYSGYSDISNQIDSVFGTTRIDRFGSLSGTLCFGGITPPATESVKFVLNSGITNEINISFAGPPATPANIGASPSTLSISAPDASHPGSASFAVNLSDPSQPWSASVYPATRNSSWLTVSQLSGTGPAQITLTANGTGFEPGVYWANIVLQCLNAIPQSVTVPVMFVLGASTNGMAITSIGNAASMQSVAASGMLLTVNGTNLANATAPAPTSSPVPYSTGGVSVTVNGIAAPLAAVSPTKLTVQVPYSAGAGPAVLGVNNNGQIAGFQFNIAPAAPAIFGDSSGNLLPSASFKAGATATLTLTGAGELVSKLKAGYWPTAGNTYQPILPLSITVGGVAAFPTAVGQATGTLGTTQVTFIVPASLAPGSYPVVVTVGGVSSPAVNLTVLGS